MVSISGTDSAKRPNVQLQSVPTVRTRDGTDTRSHAPHDAAALEGLKANRDANIPTAAAATLRFISRTRTLEVLPSIPALLSGRVAGLDADFSPMSLDGRPRLRDELGIK